MIVVVDDTDDAGDLLQQALTDADAAGANGASLALEVTAPLDDVDVVITGYSMLGDTSPLAVGACPRRRPAPVIVLTGYAEPYPAELTKAPFARVLRPRTCRLSSVRRRKRFSGLPRPVLLSTST